MNRLTAFFLAMLVSGCLTSKLPDNADFGSVRSISDLAGEYRNLGERASRESRFRTYLSHIIWPNDEGLDHEAIVSVEVEVADRKTLHVTAHTSEGIAKEDLFVVGEDFQLRSGRIYLKRKIGTPGGQVPILGLYYESTLLGLDKKGDAKYQEKGGIAGLVFMLFPIAVGGSTDVQFVKISK